MCRVQKQKHVWILLLIRANNDQLDGFQISKIHELSNKFHNIHEFAISQWGRPILNHAIILFVNILNILYNSYTSCYKYNNT